MEIQQQKITAEGVKFFIEADGKEVGRAHLYIMKNALHPEPFGLMEDVFVDESLRGQGMGTELVKQLIAKAKELGCYKLVATSRHSRPKVHELYERLGFKNHGSEFRIDF
ncbi:MAG: GNAT family N-acetyltransferase [Patescibacteria group bacterium]